MIFKVSYFRDCIVVGTVMISWFRIYFLGYMEFETRGKNAGTSCYVGGYGRCEQVL